LLSKRVLSEGVLVSAVATAGEGTGVGAGAGGDGGNGVGDTVFAIDNIACNKTPIHYIQPDLHISSYTQSNLYVTKPLSITGNRISIYPLTLKTICM